MHLKVRILLLERVGAKRTRLSRFYLPWKGICPCQTCSGKLLALQLAIYLLKLPKMKVRSQTFRQSNYYRGFAQFCFPILLCICDSTNLKMSRRLLTSKDSHLYVNQLQGKRRVKIGIKEAAFHAALLQDFKHLGLSRTVKSGHAIFATTRTHQGQSSANSAHFIVHYLLARRR